MTNLSELYLDQVNLSSLLPQSLSNLSSLTHLSLKDCNLQGEFPSTIFQLPTIQVIDLTRNGDLTGFLPEFHSSSNLKSLILYSTSFSGTLPSSIGNLKSLSILNLGFCNFVGNMPSSIGNLSQLTSLDVQFNNLTGQLPPTLGNLSQLTDLSLMYNKFSGKLPSTLGNLAKLIYLYLDTVGISGELPSTLGNLRQLEIIKLSNMVIRQRMSYLDNPTNWIKGDSNPKCVGGGLRTQ
ncbi:LRR domain containing protein [Trema orientale]|uniref:LRR domain containing protein n=1 Tax=Trema orientale TaxID=63057 RepID=A0A2P5EVH7_TREOI|nr:LRR domain containing protein [Trema orientale]